MNPAALLPTLLLAATLTAEMRRPHRTWVAVRRILRGRRDESPDLLERLWARADAGADEPAENIIASPGVWAL